MGGSRLASVTNLKCLDELKSFSRIADLIGHWARETPEAEALIAEGERLSYAELMLAIDRCARSLLALGVGRGDRVAVLCTTGPRAFVIFYALCRIGAAWVGLNPRHRRQELSYVVEDCQPKALIGIAEFEDRDYRGDLKALARDSTSLRTTISLDGDIEGFMPFEEMLAHSHELEDQQFVTAVDAVSGEDCACIVYTSGSTGKPKGAMLPQGGICRNYRNSAARVPTQPCRVLNNWPMDHIGGLLDLSMYVLVYGGTLILARRFEPTHSLDLIENEKVTFIFQTVSQTLAYLALPDFGDRNLSNIQAMFWGGEPLPPALLREVQHLAPLHFVGYGMTECCGSIMRSEVGASFEVLTNTLGKPLPGIEVCLVDEVGNPVEAGEVGKIWARGAGLNPMLGYLNRPEATAEIIVGDPVGGDGWLCTGDLARLRPDGNLAFAGREKQMFKSGGYNIYPQEIEAVLEAHPRVSVAAVVSVPDPTYTEIGFAFVASAQGQQLNAEELGAFCRDKIANYKTPKRFEVRAELPSLSSGKIDKKKLAEEARVLYQKR